jgi:tRNA G18 (ribose-2'-O)-methylase SpoU
MKDRELARMGGRFIAEGENVVRRLLKSGIETESVLVARRKVEAIGPLARPSTMVYSAGDDVIAQVVGFEFHSGVMACGIRPASAKLRAGKLLVVCQQIANTENLGALIRVAAGFGAEGIVLGETCCDPFFRQSVRVSMGTVFSIPLVRSENLARDLDWLNEFGVETVATVLDREGEELSRVKGTGKVALVFGNEAQGLDAETIAHCRRRVTIPMQLGTDSLNVAMAAAVFLYHFTLPGG